MKIKVVPSAYMPESNIGVLWVHPKNLDSAKNMLESCGFKEEKEEVEFSEPEPMEFKTKTETPPSKL